MATVLRLEEEARGSNMSLTEKFWWIPIVLFLVLIAAIPFVGIAAIAIYISTWVAVVPSLGCIFAIGSIIHHYRRKRAIAAETILEAADF